MSKASKKYGIWIDQGPPSQTSEIKNPSLRLVCFPPAGMGAWAFHGWQAKLKDIEVLPIELPGRNTRMIEARINNMEELIKQVLVALSPTIFQDKSIPYVIFGHSLGGLMAYELTSALLRRGDKPKALIVSGVRPPHLSALKYDTDKIQPSLASLPTSELFWEHFERRYGANPDLQSTLIQHYVEPLLRNDFYLLEHYQGPLSPHNLKIPVVACCASGDDRCSPEQLSAWSSYGSPSVGPHFFQTTPLPWSTPHRYIVESPQPLLDFLSSFCADLLLSSSC